MILVLCANPAVDVLLRLDALRMGEVNRVRAERRYPGGKGVHVAMALRELGEEVLLLGVWGGLTGRWVREQCAALGVPCEGPEVSEWTRTCLAIQTAGEGGETEVLGCGPAVTLHELNVLRDAWTRALRSAKGYCISGSLPGGAPSSFYADLVSEAESTGVHGFLDCTGPAFAAAALRGPFGVHLNQHESRALTGHEDLAASAREIAQRVGQAAITAGKEGLFLAEGAHVWRARVAVPEVISAVGSGDCLTAGLALARARGLPAKEAARWGVACGAANCLREELGMLHRADVERLLPQVQVEEA